MPDLLIGSRPSSAASTGLIDPAPGALDERAGPRLRLENRLHDNRSSGDRASRPIRIFVNVPQTFVRSIVPDQAVRVLVPEYPQRPFVGRIARTAGALDPTSRTLLTEVRLGNEDHALLPGMYAQVQFTVVAADAVWVVPATTLIARAAGPQVVTVRGDGTVHHLGVHLGRDLGQSVEILSGLTGQERLVVSPPDGLKEGARVAAAETR